MSKKRGNDAIQTTLRDSLEVLIGLVTSLKAKRFKETFNGDANLVITWSPNPHAKTQIPRKPSKSGLIGV
jgi:hypothetical protein